MKGELRDRIFKGLGVFSIKYYWLILIAALIVTGVFGGLTEKLKLEMSWLSMAPRKSESVMEYNKIIREFGDANPIIVTIKGDDPEKLKKVANELADEYKLLKDDIKDVNLKMDRRFIKKYGLMLQKTKELRRFKDLLADFNLDGFYKNLNNDFEKEYIEESEESLAMQEKNAMQAFDALKDMLSSYRSFLKMEPAGSKNLTGSIDKFSLGDEYFISRDKSMILIFVQQYVSMTDMDKIIPVVRKSEKVLDRFRQKYKDMEFGQTGMAVISRDEMDTGTHDTVFNLITAAVAVLVLLWFSFRMLAAPFLAILTLLLGIIWDLGIIYIVYGRLNLMTAMVGVILIGLGIDYAIHLITAYTQNRYQGLPQKEAMIQTYQKTGPGLLTGALTTAVAFLVFMISEIEVMQELGFAMGIGIICTFLSALVILPALIIAKEKIQKLIKYKKLEKKISMEYNFLGELGTKIIKRPYLILGTALLLTVISVIAIPKLHFISDFRKLEAEGLLSLDLIDEINDKFDISPDPVHIITDDIKKPACLRKN
ncbi:MAG: MMPL family transporter [Spirochaetes bacterium]|nr:MMPL family transporter [Spirochaetota bacterium]